MREYRIVRCNLGRNIYKVKKWDGFISVRFLGSQGKWVLNKDMAKVFYNREDAVSSLVIYKFKDEHKSPD